MDKTDIWNWLTQFATAYSLAAIFVIVCSLLFNGFDKAHIILEFNLCIRMFEIIAGILSFVVLSINFFIKFCRMAENE